MRRGGFVAGCFALAFLAGGACAQGASVDKLSFAVPGASEKDAAVSGDLKIPDSKHPRLPAVVILHSSPGFDGRGAFYAEALARAGFATVEIDYLRGKGIPATLRDNLPHVYETLRQLAAHPRIDPARIGVLGFSYGGMLALVSSSAELTQQYTGGKLRFAAHFALYPLCWIQRDLIAGKSKYLDTPIFRQVTGSPVQVVGAGRDGYDDDPKACEKFVAELPVPARPHFSVTVYPDATFAFDSRFSSATYQAGGNKGKGGIVTVVASETIAAQSRQLAVSFFQKALSNR